MKSIIILGDGMSDHPNPELDGKTPLQVAGKPHIDSIARQGRMGQFETVPEGLSKGSAVANLSVLGYNPREVYNGRAVLEAANMGVQLGPDDVAFRCNLICVDNGKIKNHSAGHIPSKEAEEIIQTLDTALGDDDAGIPARFYPGVSYRHLLVLKGAGASPKVKCAPPHDHVGENIAVLKPSALEDIGAATAARLQELFTKSREILENHPVNLKRIEQGKDPANAIWTWSPGKRPNMETLQQRFNVKGAVISAVDLMMGLGLYAGMDVIRVQGATGLWDTNYEGKAQACLDALEKYDLVYVHVEATDEAGHAKDLPLKIKCIEMLDDRLVRPILQGLETKGIDAIVAVLPDHPTPVATGIHARDPVPVAIMGPNITPDTTEKYDETEADKGDIPFLTGDTFIKMVLGKNG